MRRSPIQASLRGDGDEPATELPGGPAADVTAPASGPSWQRLILGTEDAPDRFDREHPEPFPPGRVDGRETSPTDGQGQEPAPTQPVLPPDPGSAPRADRGLEATGGTVELRDGPEVPALQRSGESGRPAAVPSRWRCATPDAIARRTIVRRPH